MPGPGKAARNRSVQFLPTDDKRDIIFYEMHPPHIKGMSLGEVNWGDQHPDVSTHCLIHIEPSNVRGDDTMMMYWYAPAELMAKIPRTTHQGGTFQQSLLYLKTSVMPTQAACTNPVNTLYDGYEDGPAPGILQDKFRMVTHVFRDKTIDKRVAWDDEVGVPVYTTRELMAVPNTGIPDATCTEGSTTSYDQIDKWLMTKTITGIGSDDPSYDGIVMPGTQEIEIPSILHGGEAKTVWAAALRDQQLAYQEDIAIKFDYTSPFQHAAESRITRRIFKGSALAEAYAASLGQPFRFKPVVREFMLGSAYYWTGDNVFARAALREMRTPNALIPNTINIDIPAGSPNVDVGTGSDVDSTITITADGSTVPWGEWVYWDLKPRVSRWGFWIVDKIEVLLPP